MSLVSPRPLNAKQLEMLAKLEHEQWAHWTRYMLDNLSEENIERWRKQIETDYAQLSEKEKKSDRDWAKKTFAVLELHEDFADFFKAMTDEMKRHEPEKSDTWKDDDVILGYYHRYSSLPPAVIREAMGEYLSKLLVHAFGEWLEHGNLHQLVDVANICAMIWSRKE